MQLSFRDICLAILLMGALLFAPEASAQQSQPSPGSSADSWVKYGVSNGMKGDLDGAMAAFDEAIKVDPKCAPAYRAMGFTLMLQKKYDEAIANFDQAILIDPNYQTAYNDRGIAKNDKGDFVGALADFSRTIELNPKYPSVYYNRGHVKYMTGDMDGAVSDLDQAITNDPNSPFSYFIRGLARMAGDDREGALSDLRQSATNGYPEAAFWLWIATMKSGDRGEAGTDLAQFLSKPQLFKPDAWPTPIGNFLLEKITEDQLMAKAKEITTDKNCLCQAWFYDGVSKRFSGDTKGALDCFNQAIATGSVTSEMYVEAKREAASLATP